MKKLSPTMAEALCAMANADRPVISVFSGRRGESEPAHVAGVSITNRTLDALKRRGLVTVVKTESGRQVRRWGQRGHRVAHWVDRHWELTNKGAAIACKVPK